MVHTWLMQATAKKSQANGKINLTVMHAVIISTSLWLTVTLHIASGKSCCAQVKLVTNDMEHVEI